MKIPKDLCSTSLYIGVCNMSNELVYVTQCIDYLRHSDSLMIDCYTFVNALHFLADCRKDAFIVAINLPAHCNFFFCQLNVLIHGENGQAVIMNIVALVGRTGQEALVHSGLFVNWMTQLSTRSAILVVHVHQLTIKVDIAN